MAQGFETFGLSPELLRAISDLGYTKPTEIQEKAIPLLLIQNQDFIGIAQTGTGKTAAFGLALLQKIDTKSKHIQGLILCPTRELCIQITEDLQSYAKYIAGMRILSIYGGTNIQTQIKQIKQGANIVVATPGRLLDHLQRKTIQIDQIHTLILDEADEMLNMGFKEDIDAILAQAPSTKRIWLFSATMPEEVHAIVKNYMHQPYEIKIAQKNETAPNITHRYYVCRPNDKYEVLKRLLDYYPDIYAIVFVRTKAETQEIAEKLIHEGYNADALHGDLSQSMRDKTMKRFREKHLQILVATDVAARGLDIDDITHVINYDLPDEIETYIHRAGRTARAGKSGYCLSIITPQQERKIQSIKNLIKKNIHKFPIPQPGEVVERRFIHFFNTLKNLPYDETLISDYLPRIMKSVADLSREELIKRFSYMEFLQVLKYYQHAKDLSLPENTFEDRSKHTRLFINLGEKDGFDTIALIKFIEKHTNVPKRSIKKVELLPAFSFFTLSENFADTVIQTLQGIVYKGRTIKVEYAHKNQKKQSFVPNDKNRQKKPNLKMKNVQSKSRGTENKAKVSIEDYSIDANNQWILDE
ncbi:MAG: DEAD/DEAH box helicase [Bacteroidia bacterium]|nr:DEAD/DEAH box helicase [Bacteroidia bacterium]MDW8300915.1 DEAD/DEAH box helicase [Bacteroidia bacterium]